MCEDKEHAVEAVQALQGCRAVPQRPWEGCTCVGVSDTPECSCSPHVLAQPKSRDVGVVKDALIQLNIHVLLLLLMYLYY